MQGPLCASLCLGEETQRMALGVQKFAVCQSVQADHCLLVCQFRILLER